MNKLIMMMNKLVTSITFHHMTVYCACSKMAECITYHNVEYLVLQQSLCALARAIAADIIQVASRLFEKQLISLADLEEARKTDKIKHDRANELVIQVIAQVRFYPEKYQIFLKVLEESDVHKSVLRDVHNNYEEKKKIKVTKTT